MAKTTKATVATPSLAYVEMAPYWEKVNTVLAGTEAMREAAEDMAPRHEKETDTNYNDRIGANVLFNVTDLTLRTWVGKAFAEEIEYADDFPKEMMPWMDDLNLAGDNINVFAREWFSKGIAGAFCHVMIDFPRVFREDRTRADDIREGIRPYCTLVEPERLIFATQMRIDGEEMLTHVRIIEDVVDVDEWEEVVTEQIRVLTLEWVNVGTDEDPRLERRVLVQLFRKGGDKKDVWSLYESWYMDIPFIPIVTFYSNRSGFMLGKSPIADLVDLNIRHWQSMSDQINILTVARFPILALSGGTDEEGEIIIGPKEFLTSEDPASRYYYVEHRGAAINAGKSDLADLEERMKAYGAEFMKDRPDRETASARILDSAEATSPLTDAVYRFNDALNHMLYMMAAWKEIEYAGTAAVPIKRASEEQSRQVADERANDGVE